MRRGARGARQFAVGGRGNESGYFSGFARYGYGMNEVAGFDAHRKGAAGRGRL